MKHPNIVHYFDINRDEKLLWLFMEYCPHGDLNKFFTKAGMTEKNTMQGMTQIADGLAYLHSNNIVHRDIKPANILVANTTPLELKLTDFDLSKFFEEDYETSKMSSNVGTAAFKAPEFFMRNDQKKLEYHRSVDIYALGLTYLAMIQGNKPLVPHLETAQHDSEIHNPIGSTMATRLRYGVKPLAVIDQEEDSSSALADEDGKNYTTLVRELILEMTNIEPKKRPTAAEVNLTLMKKTLNFSAKRENKKKEIHVGKYIVNAATVFRFGAFGTTYTARNSELETIAAAQAIKIPGTKESTQQTIKLLEKLLKLDHPNILKHHEVVQEGDICWLFMELCPQLDFKKFFGEANLKEKDASEAMVQMARGIEYLHSMDIVHGDVKPTNILVAKVSPLRLKVIDFDLKKHDHYVGVFTSSNIGTLIFKAPEFFMRNTERNTDCHQGVDIYSLALIFLAVIQGNEHLVPKLETAHDDSELYQSIGLTMATRLRLGKKPLKILSIRGQVSVATKLLRVLQVRKASPDSSSNNSEFEKQMRDLIQKMTRIDVDERLTAAEVVQSLVKFTQRAPTCITLSERTRWYSDLGQISMCINSKDQLIMRGRTDDRRVIKVCDRHTGKVLKEVASMCNHHNHINEVPENPDCLLEVCPECNILRLYNLENSSNNTMSHSFEPWRICRKSEKSFLVTNPVGFVHEIQLEASEGKMEIVGATKVEAQNILRIFYDPYSDLLITLEQINDEHARVQSFCLKGGASKWKFSGDVDGKPFFSRGICCNNKGLVFVGDYNNKRLLVLNSSSGDLHQIIPVDMDIIWKLEWSEKTPELTVLHGPQVVSCFSVKNWPDEK